MTATKRWTEEEVSQLQKAMAAQPPTSLFDERPQTSAIKRGSSPKPLTNVEDWGDTSPNYALDDFKPKLIKQVKKTNQGIKGRELELNFTESWGDLFYVGLNGIEIYDTKGQKI